MDCVKFLVNFGANIFSLDIDMHTPKELAAMNDCQEILRYLDDIAADQELQNAKKVKTLQEKAEKEAQKLMKNFKKIQKKADKLNEKEKKLLDKEMQKLEISSSDNATDLDGDSSNSSASTGNGSSNGVTTISGGSGGFTKFSEITNNNNFNSSSSNGKKLMGTVSKKLNLKKSQAKVDGSSAGSVPTFTISEVEDGKRSMRHLKGRRQSANVLFVPKNLEPIEDKEDELLDVKFPNPLFHQVLLIITKIFQNSANFCTCKAKYKQTAIKTPTHPSIIRIRIFQTSKMKKKNRKSIRILNYYIQELDLRYFFYYLFIHFYRTKEKV